MIKTKRERAYIELCARDMHPDLYVDLPLSEDAALLQKRYDADAQLADLRRIVLHDDIDLGYSAVSTTAQCTVHDYKLEESPYIDEAATRAKMAKALRALRSMGATNIEKDYDDYYFKVTVTMPSGLKFKLQSDRAAVCVKKVVGQKFVPATTYEARYEDIVEWECVPVSLMKM